jgi:two-component system sensor histidine kinase/response regulator
MSAESHNEEPLELAEENRRLRTALAVAQSKIEELKRSRDLLDAKLNLVARTARMWAWESDIKGDFIWDLNRPSDLGLDDVPMQELGARHFGLIEPADLQTIYAAHFAALQNKAGTITHRYRCKYPDGTTHHLEGRGAFIYDAAGNPMRIVGVTLDVTSEIQAAALLNQQTAELRDAQRRLERASLSSQEGHWDFDLRAQRFWVSSSYRQLLGYADDVDLSTREKYLALVHSDDLPHLSAAFEEHIARNAPLDIELRMRPAVGEWRWMRLRGMAELDEQKRPIRLSGSIQDIHEKKLAEDDLRLVRQRFERAIRGTQDGLWEWDLQRDTFWVSPRYEAILGYEEDKMPDGVAFRQSITHPDDIAHVAAAHEAHFAGLAPLDLEVRVRHADGKYIWIRARGEAERDAHGKPIRVAGSIQDFTEARAARDALIEATKAAQAANRAKSDFLANVSHEIRTPMNGIIGMTTLLLDTSLSRTQLEYAETIRNSADSLLTVINDILDFSKIEAGKLDIETVDLDLRRSVEDVGAMMAVQAAAKNLELIVNVRPEVPERVSGDPQRIRQCLVNLIGNAVKFTMTGEIVVEVGVIGRQNGKALVHFEVRDTGIGIDADTAGNLFQPFVQADSSTTRHFGGTGLGLSIVRRLVEMMGGKIGMDSAPGKGSTFWFDLPLSAEEQVRLRPAPSAEDLARRVLVVDRNPTACDVISAQLMTAGYSVSMASGAEDAVSMLRQAHAREKPFSIVLVDAHIVMANGAGLGEQIHADPQLGRTRAILMTSLDRRPEQSDLVAKGFHACITKPVRARELLGCIGRLLTKDAAPEGAPDTPGPTRAPEPAQAAGYAGRVLVVEDNPVNQKVAQRFLERLGCHVTLADNGAIAVKTYAPARFDLILMDLQMPVMDGYAATQGIRALERGPRVPIFALTANAMTGQLERCLAADMDGLLTKPLSVDRLRETLERVGLKVGAQDKKATA